VIDAPAPYRPSVLVRLFAAIERLPFGGWWVYPVLYLALAAYEQAALWLTGASPVGAVSLDAATAVAFGPLLLAATHYLVRTAARAMDTFQPASGLSDAEFAARRYELVTVPAGELWLPTALGAAVGIGSILTASPEGLAPFGSKVTSTLVVLGPAAVLGYAAAMVLLYQSIRQLRHVARLLDEASAIDLFDTSPLFAFSRLTASVGLVVVFVAYYAFATNAAYQLGNVLAIGVIVANVILGIVVFVVPLLGVHDRLVDEKAALVRGVDQRFGALRAELYGRVDASNISGAKEVVDTLGGLELIRQRIDKLPTWPWPPALLRGFVSAILLPIVVYLLTRVAGNVIG
jgi:hypothetical protein